MIFDYSEAFSRNLGLVTDAEQRVLSHKKVAIAGMGGVGGSHFLTLARMGIQHFHVADMDTFELANFNRQAGASMDTIGRHKADVMAEAARDINPQASIKIFSSGVNEDNLEEFLDGVDVFVDGLDFYVLDIRSKVFEKCRTKGIPVVTAGPMGGSTAYLVFNPKGMSFEEYFQFGDLPFHEKAARFLVGLAPRMAQRKHFVDLSRVSFSDKTTSSLSPACMACSAVMGMEVLKLLLGRGKTYFVPWAMQFDMYTNRYHKVYNWLGNRNLINKIKIKIVLLLVGGSRFKNE